MHAQCISTRNMSLLLFSRARRIADLLSAVKLFFSLIHYSHLIAHASISKWENVLYLTDGIVYRKTMRLQLQSN